MHFDFSAFLLFSTIGTGFIVAVNWYYWQPSRLAALRAGKSSNQKVEDREPIVIEYARSFFPVLLLVLILRSFIIEPFRIPSGSMKPTLLVGDFILVNKYAYGVRLPVLHNKIVEVGSPKRGDVMVFRYPVDPTENFIKRVVGLPGDKIEYRDKKLFINGEPALKSLGATETIDDELGNNLTVKHWVENLTGVEHEIYERLTSGREVASITVPEGHYFMMGDNRDDSDDSRAWGFVPEENIVGKAVAVWMSWDAKNFGIRTETIPRKIV